MNRKMKRAGVVIGIIAIIGACSLFLYYEWRDASPQESPSRPQDVLKRMIGKTPEGHNPFVDRVVADLKKHYSKTIQDKSTQASFLNLRNFVINIDPKNGRNIFYSIISQAFPDYAQEIMKTLDKLDQYNKWLKENENKLDGMKDSEREAALLAKRTELFGDDAEKIWTGDMLASDARRAKFREQLDVLNTSSDTTIDEKLEMFQGVLEETYKNSPEAFLSDQSVMMSKVFFSIDSVQDELKKMRPEQRQQEINNIRRKMGIPEDQIEELTKRDAYNEKRWQIGLKYMEERDRIEKEYEGPEQEKQLGLLREYYFGDEAKTIELEEKDKFFRYKRSHIYGRN